MNKSEARENKDECIDKRMKPTLYEKYFLKLKDKNLNNKKLYISFLNKHKASQKLVNYIEFVQCIVDKGTFSFQCFIPSCSEESNLKVGRLVNIEILNRDMSFL